jgi:hypothetical protein
MIHGRVKRHPEDLRALAIKRFRSCRNHAHCKQKRLMKKTIAAKKANVGVQRKSDIFRASYRPCGKMFGEGSLRFQSRKCQPLRRATR